jgi:hypothetical protein
MRHTILTLILALAGCASSSELSTRAQGHMQAAQRAARSGDYRRTVDEQRKAAYLYQRADARSYEERLPGPPPPPGPAPLPLFDPNMQRNGPAASQLESARGQMNQSLLP